MKFSHFVPLNRGSGHPTNVVSKRLPPRNASSAGRCRRQAKRVFVQLRQPMKRLLQGGSPKPKAALTEEQQIQLATELSLEDATKAAVKMSLNDHHTAAQAEPHSATEAVTMESEGKGSDDPSPNPLAHLPKPEGSVYLHASFLFLKLFFTT
mgnify:CR=1 FL=1